jgi:hypothetical protein
MGINVTAISWYYTGDQTWRQQDWDSYKFVKAVKEQTINGWVDLPTNPPTRLQASNVHLARDLFALAVAARVRRLVAPMPTIVVPIPSKSVLVDSTDEFTAGDLAGRVAANLGVIAVPDALHWDSLLLRAHEGGSRDPTFLFEHLVCRYDFRGHRIVLVDDVYTTGGHAKASIGRLREEGGDVCLIACAGRTTWDQHERPFRVPIFQIEEREVPRT